MAKAKFNKFLKGQPILVGDNTVPGVDLYPELEKLLPTIFREVRDFGCDFYPTVIQRLRHDEMSEIAAYGGFPVRYPHWKWGMEYEQLQRGYELGMHKIYEMVVNCCDLSTKVTTKRGRMDAGNVLVGDEIMGPNGWRNVVAVEKQKPSKVHKLKFKELCSDVVCTPNHKWKCLREGEMKWVKTEDIKVNDVIFAGSKYENNLNSPAVIEWDKNRVLSETRSNVRNRLIEIYPPSKMTLELAELMGVIAGDGSTGVRLSNNSVTVYVHESLDNYKQHISSLFEKVFGREPTICKKKSSCDSVYLCSKYAVDYLDFAGFKKGSTYKTKRVPWSIWNSSNEYKSAYLRGLFDTDGYCGKVLSMNCYSDSLAEDVQSLLLDLGIRSKFKRVKNKHNDIAVVTIKGKQNVRKFEKHVGFSLEYKSKRLSDLSEKDGRSGKGISYPGVMELIHERIDNIDKNNVDQWMYRYRRKSNANSNSNSLYGFLHKAVSEGFEEEFGDLLNLLETPTYEVSHNEELSDFVETVDIALDHDDHDFIANGLWSHNTNPCYIYLLERNTLVDDVLVVAHALGHCDFFKNNVFFSQTSQNMMNELANHGTRIRRYMRRHGREKVSEFIDHVMRIQTLIDPAKAWERKSIKNPVIKDEKKYRHPTLLHVDDDHEYMDSYINPKEWRDKQKERIARLETAEDLGIFMEPTKDIMKFMRDFAPLHPWQADILAMLYEESMYFAPQRQTKMLNEGWACLRSGSLVPTTQGLLPIEKIVEEKIDATVYDGEKEQVITNWFKFNRKTKTIKTKRGYVLGGSENHRIWNSNKEWIRLDELKLGDKISLSLGGNIWSESYVELGWTPMQGKTVTQICKEEGISYTTYREYRDDLYNRKHRKKEQCESVISRLQEVPNGVLLSTRKPIKIPRIVDEQFATFLGYMVGDGHVSSKKRTLGLTTGDKEQADCYKDLLSDLFGLECNCKWDSSSKNGRYRLSVTCENLKDLLVSLGLKTGKSARTKEIPDVIFRSPKSVVAAFLRAYFDSDGYAGSQGVVLSTSSIFLLEKTQVLLANFGIMSTQRKQPKDNWHLQITGKSALRFYEQIGFGLERKQKSLENYVFDRKWFCEETCEDVVVSIEEGESVVYDITVENTHRYSALGFMNHNSRVDFEIMAKRGFSALGQDDPSAGIIEYAAHKWGVLGGKYSMNPYKLGSCILQDVEERWDKGQFGTEWENCTEMRERTEWDKKLGLGIEKIFEVRKYYDDLTALIEFFTPEFCEKYEFFDWQKQPNGEYVVQDTGAAGYEKIKKKLIGRYLNGGLPEIHLVDPNHRGKGYLFLQHKFEDRPLHSPWVPAVLESICYFWKNEVYLSTKDPKTDQEIVYCMREPDESSLEVMTREQYEKQ
jgi:stage V sporulation protein R